MGVELKSLTDRLNKLKRAKYTYDMENENKQRYETKLNGLQELKQECARYETRLTLLLNTAVSINSKFIQSNLSLMNTNMTEAVRKMFPEDSFKCQVEFDNSRSDYTSEILMKNGNRPFLPVSAQNGDMMQQVLAFVSKTSIMDLYGCKLMLLDEPFSNSDEFRGEKVAELINELKVKYIILIEHKSVITDYLNANFIYIERDKTSNEVIVK